MYKSLSRNFFRAQFPLGGHNSGLGVPSGDSGRGVARRRNAAPWRLACLYITIYAYDFTLSIDRVMAPIQGDEELHPPKIFAAFPPAFGVAFFCRLREIL